MQGYRIETLQSFDVRPVHGNASAILSVCQHACLVFLRPYHFYSLPLWGVVFRLVRKVEDLLQAFKKSSLRTC